MIPLMSINGNSSSLEEQNDLQSRKRIFIVEAIADFGIFCRREEPDLVIVLQRPDADAGQLAHFMDSHHIFTHLGYPLSQLHYKL